MRYLSMETLTWQLFDVFDLEGMLKHPRYQDHDRAAMSQILENVKKMADSELYPVFREMDAQPARMENGKLLVHPAVGLIMKRTGELGLIGATLSYEAGGIQLPEMVYQSLYYIIDCANNHVSGYASLTSGAAGLVATFGSEALQEIYLAKMIEGRWGGTMALTEPQAGSSLSDVTCQAIPREDGSYSINGQKIWISGADHQFGENFIHMVLARMPDAPPGTRGISLFLVPKLRPEGGQLVPNDVTTASDFPKLGQRGYATTHLIFGEQGQCQGWLLGQANQGLAHMFQLMNSARISVGRHGAAIASAAYFASLQFARERPQGRRLQGSGRKDLSKGQELIINHADVRRMLLQQKAIAEGSLAIIMQASYYQDMVRVSQGEQARKHLTLLELLTPMTKTFPAEAGRRSVDAGLQVLGGAGFCDEYVLQQYYRDVRIMAIYEGTTGIQSLDLMGRKISMEGGAALRYLHEEFQATLGPCREDQELAPYARVFDEHLALHQRVLETLAPLAAAGEFERYLADATLYMEFLCNLVVAWLWLKMARVARQKSGDFYEAKVHAMKFFFQYELVKNHTLAEILMQPGNLTIVREVELFD